MTDPPGPAGCGPPRPGGGAPLVTLCRVDDGRVLRCEDCDRLHVRFGNLLVIRELEGFRTLRDRVREMAGMVRSDAGDGTDPGTPVYLLSLQGPETAFCFRAGEVLELRDLLDRASGLLGSGGPVPDAPPWSS